MEKKFEYKERRGLPGGPNEYITHVSGIFSVEGYKSDSPDVNNPYNIIPSGNITMKGVDFPVMGTDNLGNTKAMIPGNDYKFPGDMVFEIPLAQTGGGVKKDPRILGEANAEGYLPYRPEGYYSSQYNYEEDPESWKMYKKDDTIYRKDHFDNTYQALRAPTRKDLDFLDNYSKWVADNQDNAQAVWDRYNREVRPLLRSFDRPIKPVSNLKNKEMFEGMLQRNEFCDTCQYRETPYHVYDNSNIVLESEKPAVSKNKNRYHREYNPFTKTYEAMSPQQNRMLEREAYKLKNQGIKVTPDNMPVFENRQLYDVVSRKPAGERSMESKAGFTLTEDDVLYDPKTRLPMVTEIANSNEKPKMKYGGGLLTKTMNCNNCGWSWKAADGGNDVTTCHKCGGQAVPKAQKGGEYKVQSGDTFYGIANKNNISWEDLEKANPGIDIEKLKLNQTIKFPTATKKEAVDSVPAIGKITNAVEEVKTKTATEKPSELNLEGLKKGIAQAESLGGVLMLNPQSTATGLYGQRFSELKGKDLYKGTREEFAEDIEAQNRIFDIRLNQGIDGKRGLIQDAEELYEEYKPQIEGFDYSKEDLIGLTNFLGRQGTRYFLGYHLRDGKPLHEALPKIYSDSAKQANKKPDEYLKVLREYYKAGGETTKLSMYKNYMKGDYDGTEMEGKAEKVFDKLNRVYYRQAKALGMDAPNYIMSKIIPQG